MRWLIAISLVSSLACGPRAPAPPASAQRLAYEAALADRADPASPRNLLGSMAAVARAFEGAHRLPARPCGAGWLFDLELGAAPGWRYYIYVPAEGDRAHGFSERAPPPVMCRRVLAEARR